MVLRAGTAAASRHFSASGLFLIALFSLIPMFFMTSDFSRAEGVFDNVAIDRSGGFNIVQNRGAAIAQSSNSMAALKMHPYRIALGWENQRMGGSPTESQILSRMASLLSTSGRYLVHGVNLPVGVMPDYRVIVWIRDIDMDGTHYFDTIKADDGKRHYRRYSHTSVTGRIDVEVRVIRIRDGSLLGSFTCFASSSDTLHLNPWSWGNDDVHGWGDDYYNSWEPGHYVGGLNSYHFSINFDNRGFTSVPPRMFNDMTEDLVRGRKGSILQKLNDLLPLRGSIMGRSRSLPDNWYVNLGQRDGLRNDDRFLVIRNNRPIAIFRINQVNESNSRGKVFLEGVETPLMPQIGDGVISRGW